MTRLCQDLHPALSAAILSTLFKKSVYTCLSFVRTNPELLAKITGLQYNEILEIKDRILTKFSSQLRFGHKCYQDIINHCAIIPSGIKNLDKLLDSGFVTGNIYELCGFAGCGKTQICMTAAINICLSKSEQKVFYIDTKNDISAHRLFEIVENHNISNIGEILHRIQICQIRTSVDLLQELHQLQLRLNNSKEKYLGFKLIIIDSLSALFQFNNLSESLSLLNNVGNLLKYISVEYHIVVLLTNYAKSWTVEETEGDDDDDDGDEQVLMQTHQQVQQPALGKYWAYVPNVRIMVKKLNGSNECFLIVLKSSNQPVGKSVRIKIGNDGVT